MRDQILHEHSKSQCLKIEAWVGNNQARFDELFLLFTESDPVVRQRAGWPLLNLVRAQEKLMQKHLPILLIYLRSEGLHQACRRNGFGILEAMSIPESMHGEVMDLCFRALESHKESIAAKANALGVLCILIKAYPEIKDEIKLLVQFLPQPLPPALKSRVATMKLKI